MVEEARVNRQGACGRREVLAESGDKNRDCQCGGLLQYSNL
jgi:hypothetical protein